MHRVLLLLGSDLGDREMFLKQAISQIGVQVGTVLKTSSVYETQSWGKADAPDYLNQVVLVETELKPRAVLDGILAIETGLGRERKEKWGPRTIDIDILFYDDEVIDEPGLQIPHPQLHNRRFTLEPLAEITPEWRHPVLKKNILQLKSELSDNLIVKKIILK